MKEEDGKIQRQACTARGDIDCKDSVRFTLSDEAGFLKFKDFDIVNTPECAKLAEEIRKYLLTRPLREIDINVIRSMQCPNHRGLCIETVARAIEENLELFW